MVNFQFRRCAGFILTVLSISILKQLYKERPMKHTTLTHNLTKESTDRRETIVESKDFDAVCTERFNVTIKDNLKVIMNYPGDTADKYMWKIGGSLEQPIVQRQASPLLVTAVSSEYFGLLFGVVKSYHVHAVNRVEGVKIDLLIYDIGMTRDQRNIMKESGMPFDIRNFPFDQFPPHVRILKNMAWKPILIQMLLVEFGFVWWVDSSVRFKTLNVERVFREAKTHGLLFNTSPTKSKWNITDSTDKKTFEFLGEDSCKFRKFPLPYTNSILVYFNSISREIIRAWAKCSLDKHCIAPSGATHCDVNTAATGSCHQYDRSVLGITTSRIFHQDNSYSMTNVLNDVITVNRTDILINNCKNDICEF